MISRLAPILTVLSLSGLARTSRADVVVQVPVDALLTGRPVSTLTGGVVVPWNVGLDQGDAFVTTAANTFLKQPGPALPDDGTFPAASGRPEIVLHFSNAASATAPQARVLTGSGNFEVPVPHASYSKLYLIVASSYGDATLTLTLNYADASSTPQNLTLPDWGTGKALPTNPPIFFNLISGLHKWNQQNMSVDTPTHAITGVVLSPDMSKQLSSIRLEKTSAAQTLAFWGATGIASSAPDVGSGGAGGSGGMSSGGSGGAPTAGSGGAAASGASAGGAGAGGAAPASAGSDALGGASGVPVGGTASVGGVGGATTGNAGASVISSPAADNTSGACSLQARGRRRDQRGLAWLLALCVVAAGRQIRPRKRH